MTIKTDISDDGRVATLALSRPEKLNALTLEMLRDLESELERLAMDENIRCLVLTGIGKAFSVGADISQFSNQSREQVRTRWVRTGHRVFNQVANFPRPTLAALNGSAFGGGLELALSCDLRIGYENIKLGQPEVLLGTLPGWGGTRRLISAVGLTKARELILTGTAIDGVRSHEWGLLNEIVSSTDDLAITTGRICAQLCEPAPIAQELAKRVLNTLAGEMSETEALEALAGSLSATTEDLRCGIEAFYSKEKPEFKGT